MDSFIFLCSKMLNLVICLNSVWHLNLVTCLNSVRHLNLVRHSNSLRWSNLLWHLNLVRYLKPIRYLKHYSDSTLFSFYSIIWLYFFCQWGVQEAFVCYVQLCEHIFVVAVVIIVTFMHLCLHLSRTISFSAFGNAPK